MRIRVDVLKQRYGEFKLKDLITGEWETLQIYRWEHGGLSIMRDGRMPAFIVKEKDLIEGIKKLPKLGKR